MSIKDIIASLRLQYEREPTKFGITQEVIEHWCRITGLGERDLFDEIAAQLASGFRDRHLMFEFCDAVVNGMVGYVYQGLLARGETVWPDLFWKVYLAFDAGEYYRDAKRDEDPVEVYTRPLIAEIVEQLQTSGRS